MQKSQYEHSGIQLLGAINVFVWAIGMDMAALLSYETVESVASSLA